MAVNIGTVLVALGLDSKNFDKGIDTSKGKTKELEKDSRGLVGTLGAVEVGYLGVATAVTAFVGIAIKGLIANSEQIRVVNQLNLALANQGNFTDNVSRALQEQASALQSVTRFGDETIISGQALLAAAGLQEDAIRRATAASLDFAAAQGKDARFAFELVTKAALGQATALSRYGITVDTTKTKAEQFNEVLVILEQRFSGAAVTDVDNFKGRLDQLGNSIGDVSEGVGKLTEATFGASDTMKSMVLVVDRVANFFKQDLVIALGEARFWFLAFVGELQQGEAAMVRAFLPLAQFLDVIREKILALPGGEIFLEASVGLETFTEQVLSHAEKLETMATASRNVAIATREESNVLALAAGNIAEVNNIATVTAGTIEGLAIGTDNLNLALSSMPPVLDATRTGLDNANEGLRQHRDNLALAANKLRELSAAERESAREAASSASVIKNEYLDMNAIRREDFERTTLFIGEQNASLVAGSLASLGQLGGKFKIAAIAGALISTYLSVAKTWATFGWPAGIIPAATALVTGLLNVSKIRSQPALAHGGQFEVGPSSPISFIAGEGPTREQVTVTRSFSGLQSDDGTMKDEAAGSMMARMGRGGMGRIQVFLGNEKLIDQVLPAVEEGTRDGTVRIHSRSVSSFGD